jgi:hypothetical protein
MFGFWAREKMSWVLFLVNPIKLADSGLAIFALKPYHQFVLTSGSKLGFSLPTTLESLFPWDRISSGLWLIRMPFPVHSLPLFLR